MAETSTAGSASADYHFLQTLLDALTEAVIGIDPETGRILNCNQAAALLLTKPAEELVGKTLDTIDALSGSSSSLPVLLSEIRKDGNRQTEWHIRGTDGSQMTLAVNATMAQNGKSGSDFVLLVLREAREDRGEPADLENHNSQQELQSLNARLFEIVRERTKLIQLQREIWTLANEAASIDEALEGTINKLCKETSFPCPETALMIGHIHRAMTTDGSQRADYWFLSDPVKLAPFRALTESMRLEQTTGLIGRVIASRTLQWLADFSHDETDLRANAAKNVGLKTAVAFPVLASDDVVAVMEIFTSEPVIAEAPLLDTLSQIGIELGGIVERKRTEERLRQNELLATIGQTAAKLAHEISNPLNGMYTAMQLLEQVLKDRKLPPDDIIPSTIKDLKKELDGLRVLLHEFRTLSRPMKFEFDFFDVAEIAREVANFEAPRFGQQNITVVLDFPSDLPKANLDGEKIKQALLNLCQNAADAMPRGGTLTVRGYKLWEAICVEVQDTGAGLPESLNIFEVFTTSKRGGTGLGLPIVQQIVAGHGGGITFSSERGKGTLFRLTLPINAKEQARAGGHTDKGAIG